MHCCWITSGCVQLWCVFRSNIRRTPSTMPPTDGNKSLIVEQDWMSRPSLGGNPYHVPPVVTLHEPPDSRGFYMNSRQAWKGRKTKTEVTVRLGQQKPLNQANFFYYTIIDDDDNDSVGVQLAFRVHDRATLPFIIYPGINQTRENRHLQCWSSNFSNTLKIHL